MEGVSRAHPLAWMSVPLFATAAGSSTQTGEVCGEALVGFAELALDGKDSLCISYSILVEIVILTGGTLYKTLIAQNDLSLDVFCCKILCACRLYVLPKFMKKLSYFG